MDLQKGIFLYALVLVFTLQHLATSSYVQQMNSWMVSYPSLTLFVWLFVIRQTFRRIYLRGSTSADGGTANTHPIGAPPADVYPASMAVTSVGGGGAPTTTVSGNAGSPASPTVSVPARISIIRYV